MEKTNYKLELIRELYFHPGEGWTVQHREIFAMKRVKDLRDIKVSMELHSTNMGEIENFIEKSIAKIKEKPEKYRHPENLPTKLKKMDEKWDGVSFKGFRNLPITIDQLSGLEDIGRYAPEDRKKDVAKMDNPKNHSKRKLSGLALHIWKKEKLDKRLKSEIGLSIRVNVNIKSPYQKHLIEICKKLEIDQKHIFYHDGEPSLKVITSRGNGENENICRKTITFDEGYDRPFWSLTLFGMGTKGWLLEVISQTEESVDLKMRMC